MCIRQIHLEHFRCYDDQQILLKPGVNLLVGDNASGKTTVLKACRYVLSAFFAGYSDENTCWISPSDNDFSLHTHNGIILHEQPIRISFTLVGDNMPNATYIIQKNSKKNSRSLIGGLSGYRDFTRQLLTSNDPLPLFTCFSTEDIHTTRKINANKFTAYNQRSSFGYYECLNSDGFLPFWQKRLLVLQEAHRGENEIEAVRTAIGDCMGDSGCQIIQSMEIRHNQGKVYYTFCDGRETHTDLLSDGFRRIVSITTDIAIRCALLNGRIYGSEAPKHTTGTVLIDEIDMHLHPAVQARILAGLTHAFPHLQFIVTTHAPMVMTNVEENECNRVYHLDFRDSKYSIYESSTYGMDASTIIENVLRQTPRANAVEEKLGELFRQIDEGNTEQARRELETLRDEFHSKLPELAKAEAMIHFLTGGYDEED